MQQTAIIDMVEELKSTLDRLGYDYTLLQGSVLKQVGGLELPESYKLFLEHFVPNGSEIRFAQYHAVTFYAQTELESAQIPAQLHSGWFTIGSFDDQPLLIKPNESEDGDPPVYRMAGTQPLRMGGSLFQFLRILQLSLDMLGVLSDFDEAVPGYQDEEETGYHDSYEDSGAMHSREEVIEEFYRELEMVDPESADGWFLD
jgi:hypothetical protein